MNSLLAASLRAGFRAGFAPAARRFQRALADPEAAQDQLRNDLATRLAATDYGRHHGVRDATSWDRLPPASYDELAPWVQRQIDTEGPVLTPERVLFYERTSGSAGAAKMIPYTASLRSSFSRMFQIWSHDMLTRGPRLGTGRLYFFVSPQLHREGPTAAGRPVGIEDDGEYLEGPLRRLLSPFLVPTREARRTRDPDAFRHALAQDLLREPELELISVWSPTLLKVLLDHIRTHRVGLVQELAPHLTRPRLTALADREAPWTSLWPALKLVSCWDEGHATGPARQLRTELPGVLVQGKGLLATEAPVTVPLLDAPGPVPLVNEVLLEFLAEGKGRPLPLHALVPGPGYEVLVSTRGGLSRYRLGDRVEVAGHHLRTPCLRFLGRAGAVSDLVGEKLNEEFVRARLEHLDLGGASFVSLVPVLDPSPGYLLLADRTALSPAELGRRVEAALGEAVHYRRARDLGQLSPVEALVSPRIPELLLAHRISPGGRLGDVKQPVLDTRPAGSTLVTALRGAEGSPSC